MIRNVLRGVKDGALSASMKKYLNDKFEAFGEVTSCDVDTKVNRIELEAMLKGERQPLVAAVERYEVEQEGEDRFIVLKRFSSSREWLGLLLTKLFVGKRYKLPSAVTRLL